MKGFEPLTLTTTQASGESWLFEFPKGFNMTHMSSVVLSVPSTSGQGVVTSFQLDGKTYAVMELGSLYTSNIVPLLSSEEEDGKLSPANSFSRGFRIVESLASTGSLSKPASKSRIPVFPSKEELGRPFRPLGSTRDSPTKRVQEQKTAKSTKPQKKTRTEK